MAGQEVRLTPDTKKGNMKSTTVTLSATPNTVTSIVIPTDAQGFGIRPAAATVRYNFDVTVAAEATLGTADQDGVASDLSNGGYAFAGEWMWRNCGEGTSRMLYLLSATASAVVYVEFF